MPLSVSKEGHDAQDSLSGNRIYSMNLSILLVLIFSTLMG
uniref:Uncharacterized protein n=1 Tax=Octopus bimaculoides TaxID=37653 RepID=A0A0L8GWE4_OCTBM